MKTLMYSICALSLVGCAVDSAPHDSELEQTLRQAQTDVAPDVLPDIGPDVWPDSGPKADYGAFIHLASTALNDEDAAAKSLSIDKLAYNDRIADSLSKINPFDVWLLEPGSCDDAFIDLASREGGDTVLFLYAHDGRSWQLIDHNNDCRGSSNSCLERALDKGVDYAIVATSFDYVAHQQRPSFSYELEVVCRDSAEAQQCGSRGLDPCPTGSYCDWDPEVSTCGDNDHPGTCTPRPDFCPLFFDPVCGCDGTTYSNTCFAALAGVSVASDGACEAPVQGVGETCAGIAGSVCAKGLECNFGDNVGCNISDIPVLCVAPKEPVFCPEIFDPVCGCDGVTYSNDCKRRRAGVPLDHPGACEIIE